MESCNGNLVMYTTAKDPVLGRRNLAGNKYTTDALGAIAGAQLCHEAVNMNIEALNVLDALRRTTEAR